jgi:hypothetical protein
MTRIGRLGQLSTARAEGAAASKSAVMPNAKRKAAFPLISSSHLRRIVEVARRL